MNDQKDGIKKRMRDLRDHFAFRTNQEFATATGVSESNLKRILKQGTLGQRSVVSICGSLGISPEWLRYGEGPMLLSEEQDGVFRDGDPGGSGDIDPESYAYIRKAKPHLSAGGGIIPEEAFEADLYAFRRSWLRTVSSSSPQRLILMEVRGDSMDPKLKGGDMVLVDMGDTVVSEGIYAYGRGDAIFIKNVKLTKNGYAINSENDKEYTEETAGLDELRIIGRIIWLAREIK